MAKNPQIKCLTLHFTRIQNKGLVELLQTLKFYKWKGIREQAKMLYALNLTNNFLDAEGLKAFVNVFHDPFEVQAALKEHAPLPISLRILILDYNFIGTKGADVLAEIIYNSRVLKVLSLNRTRLVARSMLKFSESLGSN